MSRRVLLITGDPGSGKSTLAGVLARHYGWTSLAKDEIKDVLLAVLGAEDAEASRRLSDASFALQFLLAGRLEGPDGVVMLEGNFRPGSHEAAVRGALGPHAGPPAQVLCQVSEPLRRARLAARAESRARHPGHGDGWLAARPPGADFLDLPGPKLHCPGDGPVPASVLAALDQWRLTSSTSL